MGTFVRGAVMLWTAAMLTAHYVGAVKNMDATFIAGLFTSTLATFGVTAVRKEDAERQPRNPGVESKKPTSPEQ